MVREEASGAVASEAGGAVGVEPRVRGACGMRHCRHVAGGHLHARRGQGMAAARGGRAAGDERGFGLGLGSSDGGGDVREELGHLGAEGEGVGPPGGSRSKVGVEGIRRKWNIGRWPRKVRAKGLEGWSKVVEGSSGGVGARVLLAHDVDLRTPPDGVDAVREREAAQQQRQQLGALEKGRGEGRVVERVAYLRGSVVEGSKGGKSGKSWEAMGGQRRSLKVAEGRGSARRSRAASIDGSRRSATWRPRAARPPAPAHRPSPSPPPPRVPLRRSAAPARAGSAAGGRRRERRAGLRRRR